MKNPNGVQSWWLPSRHVLVWALLLVSLDWVVGAGDDDYVWWEARKGAREYEVTTSVAKTWFFYARKTVTPEAFRWRFDDQPWNYVLKFKFRGSRLPSKFLKTDAETLEVSDHVMDSFHAFADAVKDGKGPSLGWIALGKVKLGAGTHRLQIEPEDGKMPDFRVFMLHDGVFTPRGGLKPDAPLPTEDGWWAFAPEFDSDASPLVDLRSLLNEPYAGSQGFIKVGDESYVHGETGAPIRFWATHYPSIEVPPALLEEQARFLARRGINLLRIYPFHWRNDGPRALEPDPVKIRRFQRAVEVFKKQGIYVMLGIYSGRCVYELDQVPGFEGCDPHHAPFLLHLFHPAFRKAYDTWLRSLLTAENPYTGVPLAKEPAILGIELQNEANTLWFAFQAKHYPPKIWAMVEDRYTQWLEKKYGSIDAAWKAWQEKPDPKNPNLMQDAWKLANQSKRGADQVRFCAELERGFNEETKRFLRDDLGCQSLILCGNWDTVQNDVLYPALAWMEDPGDFSDHHHYFSAPGQGGRFRNRSGLRWEGMKPEQSVVCCGFIDVIRNGKPVMCSEYSWLGNNMWRPEYPILVACQSRGAGMDAMVDFQMGAIPGWAGSEFKWVRQNPGVLGQYPAAALLFRRDLLEEGKTMARMRVNEQEALDLKAGQLVTKDRGIDFNRAFNGGAANAAEENAVANKGVYFSVGKINLDVGPFPTENTVEDLAPYWDEEKKTLRHSNGRIVWDYGEGLYLVDAPGANAALGFLDRKKEFDFSAMKLTSPMRFGSVCLVSLDDRPLPESRAMLLQVMSEMKQNGERFSQPDARGYIQKQGESRSPYMVKNIQGTVKLLWPGAEKCRVIPLKPNFTAAAEPSRGAEIKLAPNILYYLVEQQ